MAFHFFTDIDLIASQQSNQSFGPAGTTTIASVVYDQYRLTSMHSASADLNAYAICSGIVFVQQDLGNSSLVNLILLPNESPNFDFPKIRFFIYKGILKSSLINGTDIAATGTNDLTTSIWDSQNARNASAGTSDNPPAESLGIDLSSSALNTDFIEDIFYRDGVNYQFPNVVAGWSIGTFDNTQFGLEIVLENGAYDPVLLVARTMENYVKVPALTGSETQPEEFEHWHDKEVVLNYVDPCAFFGMFYHDRLLVHDSLAQVEEKTGDDLYDDVLIKFFNKNVIYLDVRNEYGFSYNYFKNYGASLNLATANNTIGSVDYYSSLWPILTLTTGDFPSGNNDAQNIVRIAMPDANGENMLPALFVSSGFLSEMYPERPLERQKLLHLTVSSGFTEEVSFSVPNPPGLNTTAPVGGYTRVKYLKRFDHTQNPPVSSGTVIRAASPLDHIFTINGMRVVFSSNNVIRSIVYDSEHYCDFQQEFGKEFILRTGLAEDNLNATYFAYPEVVIAEEGIPVSSPLALSGFVHQGSDIFLNTVITKYQKSLVKKEYILNPSNVEFLDIVTPIEAPQLTGFDQPNFDELLSLALDKATEFATFQSIVATNFIAKYPVFIGIANETSGIDEDGYAFSSFDIVLRGYEITSNILQVKEVNTNTKIYG
ncbi:MAG: hypothetical protein L6Q81_12585 [Bacteroidia bacterium]|nr:hypothetical protein [Bacteroidia bacterium]